MVALSKTDVPQHQLWGLKHKVKRPAGDFILYDGRGQKLRAFGTPGRCWEALHRPEVVQGQSVAAQPGRRVAGKQGSSGGRCEMCIPSCRTMARAPSLVENKILERASVAAGAGEHVLS